MSQPVQLPGFLHVVAPPLDHAGYLAVGLLSAEDFGVPSPGETIPIAASVYAGAGRLSIVAVGVIGFAAAVLGDSAGYAIGRFGGRTLVPRFDRYVLPGAAWRQPCRATRTRPVPGHGRGQPDSRLVPRWRATSTAWSAS